MNDQLVLTLMIALTLAAVLLAIAIDDQPSATGAASTNETDEPAGDEMAGGESVDTIQESDTNEGDDDARRPADLPATARR